MLRKPISDANIQSAYRVRITLFLIGAFLLVLLLIYLSQGLQTLNALGQVERERDQWQRPADVIQALNLIREYFKRVQEAAYDRHPSVRCNTMTL